MKRIVALGALLGITMSPLAVSAADATASLTVSASVTNNCKIDTSPLTFSQYDPVGTNAATDLEGTGRVTVACTKGAQPKIGLGSGSSALGTARRLSDSAGNYLSYDLYHDASGGRVWNNSDAGMLQPIAATSKAPRDFTVYGRIASNQDVPAGTYKDSVVATVNF
jgi:spore coat protein U-like protein